MRELLQEIFSSIRKNKLRTALTGFSVAWGIFMLVILLGSGNGLKNGVMANYGTQMVNSIRVRGGYTSKAHNGHKAWRRIRLNSNDVNIIENEFPEIDEVALQISSYGKQISYGNQFLSTYLYSVTTGIEEIEGVDLTSGRFINERDNEGIRKVVVIDDKVVDLFFKDVDPIGKQVKIEGSTFTVVGVVESMTWGGNSLCYLPISTGTLIYNGFDFYAGIGMHCVINGVATKEQVESLSDRIRKRLSKEHNYAPDDKNALWIWNRQESYQDTMMIFNGISIFVWIIGLGTLMAGIVGVSNIMLVTVRERTFEFGIRKALGARPGSIIRLILFESVIITALFGYIGMILGVGVMEIINTVVENSAVEGEHTMFVNPTLDISITISATVVLVVAGLIAGYVPARRAARLKTIDALRFNK